MRYAELAGLYQRLEKTAKRLEKTREICAFLKQTPPEELDAVVLLIEGRVFAGGDKRTLGVSDKLIIKGLKRATGAGESAIERRWAKLGDLGLVAEELVSAKAQSTLVREELEVRHVLTTLRKLAGIEGHGSVDVKLKLLSQLLSAAEPIEARYLIRTVLEELRVGIASGTLRDAICWAYLDPPISLEEDLIKITDRERYNELIDAVQSAYDRTNDFTKVARAAREGERSLREVPIEPGVPLKVMLAQRVATIAEGFERVERPAQLEYKYDGFRLQIHKHDGIITLFTRRLENVTAQFPDVVEAVAQQVAGAAFILDAEAVGYDPQTERYQPFQQISQRIRRKYRIKELAQQLPVEVNLFDLLSLEGESLLDVPLRRRRELLEGIVTPKQRRIRCSEALTTDDDEQAGKFYQQALADGQEGVMFKNLNGTYKPGSRVGFMVKLKPTMETLDLVIVGAEWGEGKRKGWLTSYTLACRDEEGELLTIGRVGTGFKELEQEGGVTFERMSELLRPHIRREQGREVELEPSLVVEIKFEEIQKSPSYTSGYALRFPRLVRIREDRGPEEISTIDEVERGYQGQH